MHIQTHIYECILHIYGIQERTKETGTKRVKTHTGTSPWNSTCCVIVWQIVPPIVNTAVNSYPPNGAFTHHNSISVIVSFPFFPSPSEWPQFIYLFFRTHITINTDIKAKFSIHIILPMIMSHISTTKQTICESLMREWRVLKCFKLTAWASLCHVNKPGIKGSTITHPCGSATVEALRAGAATALFCCSRTV